MADFNESRLEIAKSLGATATVVLREGQSQSEIKNKIIQELGRMPDKVFECSGAEAGIRLTIEVSWNFEIHKILSTRCILTFRLAKMAEK